MTLAMLALALLLAQTPAAAAAAPAPNPSAPRDWASTLRIDAQAMHDLIAKVHPGPVNRADPGFAARNDRQLRIALRHARGSTDQKAYNAALRRYVAAFDDGHLSVAPTRAWPNDFRWPGFLTAYDLQGVQRVVTRADDAAVPVGARLVSCDGVAADALATRILAPEEGRWFLASRRMLRSWRLFIDPGDPSAPRPRRCVFEVEGQPRSIALAWRPISDQDVVARFSDTGLIRREPIAARTLPSGLRWYTLSDFNGDPNSPAGKGLPALIADMEQNRDAILAAPAVVLDLRGNNGGSSEWSHRIARALWGSERVEALHEDAGLYVEWRPSNAAIAQMRTYLKERAQPGGPLAEQAPYFKRVIAGMEQAKAQGHALWRESEPEEAPSGGRETAPSSQSRMATPILFVTDPGCGSACLDAADLWLALGAVQVGRETSADTLYMDVTEATLPSGLMQMSLPMKVYRGRPRGSNVPLKPRHVFPGDLRDTAALQAWIEGLPEVRKVRPPPR